MWRAVMAVSRADHEESPAPALAKVGILDVASPARAAAQLVDEDTPVLVAAHAVHAREVRLVRTLLAGMRPEVPVAVAISSQAPIASLVALAMACDLATDAGHAHQVWHELSRSMWSGAVLPSVTHLSEPNPSFGQHLTSWLPSSRFLVRLAPDPIAFPAAKAGRAFANVPRGGSGLVVSAPGATDPLIAGIVGATAPPWNRALAVPGRWDAVFGRPEHFQLVLVPQEAARFVAPPGGPCPCCGLATTTRHCSYCRVTSARPPGQRTNHAEMSMGGAA